MAIKSASPEEIIAHFWHERARKGGINAARFHTAHTEYDCCFLEQFCNSGSKVLDLGCGTLTLGNWLAAERGALVHGVDSQQAFLDNAIRHSHLTTERADLRSYRPNSMFDVVLLFGVIHYLIDKEERSQFYRELTKHIVIDGYLLIKSQFGRDKDVVVNKYAKEFSAKYYSRYPSLKDEVALLSKFYEVQEHYIYPKEMSPHENTIFVHLACRVKA